MSTENNKKSVVSSVSTNKARQDYMESSNMYSSKGKERDPLTQQRITYREVAEEEITNLYETNRIFQNVIDIPAEDATREMFDIIMPDEELKKQLMNKLQILGLQNKLQQMIKYERLFGDGLIMPGFVEKGTGNTLSSPVNPSKLADIAFLTVFARNNNKVQKATIDKNLMSPTFGKIKSYSIPKRLLSDTMDSNTIAVDASRILRLCTVPSNVDDNPWGIPLLQMMYDHWVILDSTAWSTGQIVYSFVFKILKSDEINFGNDEERLAIEKRLEKEFNTMTLAVIGKDDELTFASPTNAMNNLNDIFSFVWELLAGGARMPKSHMLGQQQGVITGGSYDSLNYYSRIESMQKNHLTPIVEQVIDWLLIANNSGVGNGSLDPAQIEYQIKWNPLWQLDASEAIKVAKANAETDKIYIEQNVRTPDEVRKERFGLEGLGEEYNADLEEGDLSGATK